MDNQPAAQPEASRNPWVRFGPWLMILLGLLFVGFIRIRLLEVPLERDEGEYAYAGQLILQGIPPYELAYNMKLPGTYFAYAAGMAVFGQTISGIHLMLLAVNSLTTIFVFLLGRKLFGTAAGVVAGLTYAIMSVSPAVYGLATHATHFVVLFAVPATLLLWRACEANERRFFFFSGLLYGLAFLMKQPGICFGLFGAAVLLGQVVRNRSVCTRDTGARFLVFGTGMAMPFTFICLAAFIAGDFQRFWFWTFTYAGVYAAATPLAIGGRELLRHLQHTAPVSWGLWSLALAGLPFAWSKLSCRKPAIFLLVFFGFSFLGTASGLYFRWHYFVLMLPAFALLLGQSYAGLRAWWRGRRLAAGVPLLFAAICLWTVYFQRWFLFQMSPVQISQTIYQNNPFVESVTMAQYIRAHSSGDARVAVVGSEPEIYFYAHRHSATGYIYTYPLDESQPYAAKMQREMMSEIESNQPEYLVLVMYKFSWLLQSSSDPVVFHWVDWYAREFYEPVGAADLKPTGEIVYFWGDDARHFHDPLGQFIIIYKRKPAPEAVPGDTTQPAVRSSSRSVFNRNWPQAASMSWPFSRRNVAITFCFSSAARNFS